MFLAGRGPTRRCCSWTRRSPPRAVLGELDARGVKFATLRMRSASQYVEQMAIRPPNVQQKIRFLSGGNQQKAITARSLSAQPKVLIRQRWRRQP